MAKRLSRNKTGLTRFIWHGCVVLVLTIITQIGGVAWLISRMFRQKVSAFLMTYFVLFLSVHFVAVEFGRVAITCDREGALEVQSWMYCALNRTYVTPKLAAVLEDTASEMDRRYPGTKTQLLDASFPFFDGFPMLPHLSHDDGRKADLAFYYRDKTGYLPGATRSLIGFFAFEEGPTDCAPKWPTLRWDLAWAQGFWRDYDLDEPRLAAILEILAADPRVEKILIEPHLVDRLGVRHPKIRFQGCQAARHDDHIHFQVH